MSEWTQDSSEWTQDSSEWTQDSTVYEQPTLAEMGDFVDLTCGRGPFLRELGGFFGA
jgi:hypothetical protein